MGRKKLLWIEKAKPTANQGRKCHIFGRKGHLRRIREPHAHNT